MDLRLLEMYIIIINSAKLSTRNSGLCSERCKLFVTHKWKKYVLVSREAVASNHSVVIYFEGKNADLSPPDFGAEQLPPELAAASPLFISSARPVI